MTTEHRELLNRTLDRQLHWIGAADGKIAPVLAIDTAMLGVISALAPQPDAWPLWLAAVVALTLSLLGVSVVQLFRAGFPQTDGPTKSLVYFGGIANHTEEQFRAAILSVSDDAYAVDLAAQCYRNAEIAGAKFTHVRRATRLMFVALIPWMISVYSMYRLQA